MIEPVIILAIAPKLVYFIVIAALAYMSHARASKQAARTIVKDHKPSSSSVRGSFMARLVGRRRVGTVISWVGDRKITEETVSGSGGGKGGGLGGGKKKQKQAIYNESAWHLLCVGPAFKLHTIWQNGKIVWSGEITRTSHPSGSSIDLGIEGQFRIFWGETDQPINTFLADENRVGIASRWPYACYVEWTSKRLGPSAVWPLMDYEIEVVPLGVAVTSEILTISSIRANLSVSETEATGLGGSIFAIKNEKDQEKASNNIVNHQPMYIGAAWDAIDMAWKWPDGSGLVFENWGVGQPDIGGSGSLDKTMIMDDGTWKAISAFEVLHALITAPITDPAEPADYILLPSNTLIDSSSDPDQSIQGINPAHVINELLFSEFPHGAGLDQGLFELESLDIASLQLETERIASHVLFEEGETLSGLLASILQEINTLIFWDPEIGRYSFTSVRSPSSFFQIQDDLIINRPEIETLLAERPDDNVIFSFPDITKNFRTDTISISDDSQARQKRTKKADSVNLILPIETVTANKLAVSRAQQSLTSQARVELKVSRGGKNIRVGDIVKITDIESTLLVLGIELILIKDYVILSCIINNFGIRNSTRLMRQLESAKPVGDVPLDALVHFIEVPRYISTEVAQIVPLRIRSDVIVSGVNYWISRNGNSYTQVDGEVMRTTGGRLQAELSISSFSNLDVGPTIDLVGVDFDVIEDLNGREEEWRAGRQVCVIGDEICFLKAVDINADDNSATLRGVLRARLGTERVTWPIATKVFIFQYDELVTITDLVMSPKKETFMKTQPLFDFTAADLATIEPVQKTLVGSDAPIQHNNLRSQSNANEFPTDNNGYRTGQDTKFTWDYKSSGVRRTGAGFQNAGDAWSESFKQGVWTLFIKDISGNVKKKIVNLPDTEYILPSDDIVPIFGSTPLQFRVSVQGLDNGLNDLETEIIVARLS